MGVLKLLAVLFGIGFLAAGIGAFVPAWTPDGYLFGIFHVNTMHNVVHIVTGVIALLAAFKNYAKLFFQVFGVVYAVVTVWGFWTGDVLGMHMNTADNILHLVIAVIALYLGFLFSKAK